MEKILPGLILAIVVLVAVGCASSGPSPDTPPTVDVTGNWVGTWMPVNPSFGIGAIQMTLQQTGAQFTGTLLMTGGVAGGLNGFTQGLVFGNQVRVMQPAGWVGNLAVQGNTMSGMILMSGIPMGGIPTVGGVAGTSPYSVTLTRQR